MLKWESTITYTKAWSLVVGQSVVVCSILYASCCFSKNGIFHFRFRFPSLASIELNSLCLSSCLAVLVPVLRNDSKSLFLLHLRDVIHCSKSLAQPTQSSYSSQMVIHALLWVWQSQWLCCAIVFSIRDPRRITLKSSTGTECIWNVKAEKLRWLYADCKCGKGSDSYSVAIYVFSGREDWILPKVD